jgi:hypothetical protein
VNNKININHSITHIINKLIGEELSGRIDVLIKNVIEYKNALLNTL